VTLLPGRRAEVTADAAATVAARLRALDRIVELGGGRLDDALLAPARELSRRAGERLRLSGTHTVVALAGATGSGKSSLFNALSGADISPVGVRRPTTSHAYACVWGVEGAAPLVEWLGVPRRQTSWQHSDLDLAQQGDRVPVLMLTARGEVVDRVVGLELGADDYLAKPFALRELVARVRALLRRSTAATAPVSVAALELGGVRFDFLALTAESRRGPVELTAHDILVLKVLAERRGEIVPRIDIVEEVSGLDSEATLRKVDNHVVALRRAIGDDPRHPRFIHTVRGSGYRLARADNA